MINTEWKFKIKKTIPYVVSTQQKDIVESFLASCVATDSEDAENTASTTALISFNISEGVAENFLELTEVNNETLKNWVIDRLGQDWVTNAEQELIETLENN